MCYFEIPIFITAVIRFSFLLLTMSYLLIEQCQCESVFPMWRTNFASTLRIQLIILSRWYFDIVLTFSNGIAPKINANMMLNQRPPLTRDNMHKSLMIYHLLTFRYSLFVWITPFVRSQHKVVHTEVNRVRSWPINFEYCRVLNEKSVILPKKVVAETVSLWSGIFKSD